MLDIWIGDKGRQSGLFGIAFGALFERNIAVRARGAGDRHVDPGGAGHDFLNALEQAAEAGRGADNVMFEVRAVDALVDRIFAHGDRRHFDERLVTFLIIVVRPFSEGAFVLPFFRRHHTLDDDFTARRHHEIHRLRFHHFQRLP